VTNVKYMHLTKKLTRDEKVKLQNLLTDYRSDDEWVSEEARFWIFDLLDSKCASLYEIEAALRGVGRYGTRNL
jgi:hypothetical protein